MHHHSFSPVTYSKNPAKFFAGRLYKSMKGAGTDEETLTRVMVSRCEIDMVHIKTCFASEYNERLYKFIKVSLGACVAQGQSRGEVELTN